MHVCWTLSPFMSRVLHLVPPDELGLLLFIYLSASVFYLIQQTLLRMWFPAPPNKLNKFFWIQFFSLTPSSFIPPPPPFFFNLSWLMIFLSRTQSEALWGKREKVVVVVRVGKDWMEEQKKKWEKRVLWENTHLAIFPVYFFPRRTRG